MPTYNETGDSTYVPYMPRIAINHDPNRLSTLTFAFWRLTGMLWFTKEIIVKQRFHHIFIMDTWQAWQFS